MPLVNLDHCYVQWMCEGLILKNFPEKGLFALSSVPPLVLSVWTLCFLQLKPKVWLESISIPGYKIEEPREGIVKLTRLEGDSICDKIQTLKEGQSRLVNFLNRPGPLGKLSRQVLAGAWEPDDDEELASPPLSPSKANTGGFFGHPEVIGVPPAAGMPSKKAGVGPSVTFNEDMERQVSGTSTKTKGEEKEREIWINLRHLVRTSFVPILFLQLFFWDSAVLHRRASLDFPLAHCMDAGSSNCFYIKTEYSVLAWPDYIPLGCDDMRNNTISDKDKFHFKEPPGAKFYKCYTNVFRFGNVVGALGDVMALSAVAAAVIIYGSVQYSQVAHEKDVMVEIRHTRRRIVGFMLVFLFSLSTIHLLYGRWTNDAVFYMFFPGLCVWMWCLLLNRLDLLGERLKGEVKAEEARPRLGDADSESATALDEDEVGCIIGRCDEILEWVFSYVDSLKKKFSSETKEKTDADETNPFHDGEEGNQVRGSPPRALRQRLAREPAGDPHLYAPLQPAGEAAVPQTGAQHNQGPGGSIATRKRAVNLASLPSPQEHRPLLPPASLTASLPRHPSGDQAAAQLLPTPSWFHPPQGFTTLEARVQSLSPTGGRASPSESSRSALTRAPTPTSALPFSALRP